MTHELINDRLMYLHEITNAQQELPYQKEFVKNFTRTSLFKEEFRKYIELLITVKGHAWCMDVKGERNKMSRLVANAAHDLFQIGMCQCGHDERSHCISPQGKRTDCGATFSCRCKRFKINPSRSLIAREKLERANTSL